MKKKTHNFKDKLPRLDYQFGTHNFVINEFYLSRSNIKKSLQEEYEKKDS